MSIEQNSSSEQAELERCAAHGRRLGLDAPALSSEQRQLITNIVNLIDEQDDRWLS